MYYGRCNRKVIPKKGVEYFMLDEHIKKSVEKEIEIFKKEIEKLLKTAKKDFVDEKVKHQEEIKSLKIKIKILESYHPELHSKNIFTKINKNKCRLG